MKETEMENKTTEDRHLKECGFGEEIELDSGEVGQLLGTQVLS